MAMVSVDRRLFGRCGALVAAAALGCGANGPRANLGSPSPSNDEPDAAQVVDASAELPPSEPSGRDAGFVANDGGDVDAGSSHDAGPDAPFSSNPHLSILAGSPGGFGALDGSGSSARLGQVRAIAARASGELVLVESSTHLLRKVDPSSGRVTTLAGLYAKNGYRDAASGGARFDSPEGVAIFGNNAFIADTNNHVIRRVDLSSGTVTTFAGQAGSPGNGDGSVAAAHFSHPRGLATDGTTLYVADTDNHSIRTVDLTSGVVATLAGAGVSGTDDGVGLSARFQSPTALSLDLMTGTLVVGEQSRVRAIALASSNVSTIPGTFDHVLAVACDASGNVFLTHQGDHAVWRLHLGTGNLTLAAGAPSEIGTADAASPGAARFHRPWGLTVGAGGEVFIGDGNNALLRRLSGSQVSTVAGTPPARGNADGQTEARFSGPSGIASDALGNVYVTDTQNRVVRKVTPTGMVTTLAGGAFTTAHPEGDGVGAAADFGDPRGAYVDGLGNLYVADYGRKTIRKVVLASGAVTTIAGRSPSNGGGAGSTDGIGSAARFSGPRGVVGDGADLLFIADADNHAIRQIRLSTGEVSTLAGSPTEDGTSDGTGTDARFSAPNRPAYASGVLYVPDSGAHTLRKITVATREVTTLAGYPNDNAHVDGIGAAARFFAPCSAMADGAGYLLIAECGNGTIRRLYLPTNQVTTVVGSPVKRGVRLGPLTNASLNMPVGLALLAGGTVGVTDGAENSLLLLRLP